MKNFIDLAYIEVLSKAEASVNPDRIYISITLDELSAKNKTSVEQLDQLLVSALRQLDIDTEKDLSLLSLNSKHKTYFIKNNEIAKTKIYSLLVYDAVTAGKVLTELEKVGISNIDIEKTEYSKSEELILDLKCEAIVKSKKSAVKMTALIDQNIGKAINIREINILNGNLGYCEHRVLSLQASSLSKNKSLEPILVEFKKINFEVELEVKYILL